MHLPLEDVRGSCKEPALPTPRLQPLGHQPLHEMLELQASAPTRAKRAGSVPNYAAPQREFSLFPLTPDLDSLCSHQQLESDHDHAQKNLQDNRGPKHHLSARRWMREYGADWSSATSPSGREAHVSGKPLLSPACP